ncbi:MAG: hypothetical protein QCI82_10350 [Candidatus Thermoplasmatota archaeon]|nr:hypothetical protein [Candidatus Thermoplasmatota archaeon]
MDISCVLLPALMKVQAARKVALTANQEGKVSELLKHAKGLSDAGDYASATKVLERIEPMTVGYEENKEILMLLSMNLEILGELERAQEVLGTYVERYPRSSNKVMVKRAQILGTIKGGSQRAVDLYRGIIAGDRSDPEAYCSLAELYHDLGVDDKAKGTMREAEGRVGSRDVEASTMLSRTYRKVLDDPESARRVSDSMYGKWKKKTYDYWLERAIIYLDLDLLKAEEALSKASSFRREDPQFHEAMAALLERKGLPDKAREQMKRARALRWGEGSD